MRIAYQYKLVPDAEQKATMNRWLDMLRARYNWLLADRFDWWEKNRCDINACPLVCHLPELRDNPNYYSQKRSLVLLKQDRPPAAFPPLHGGKLCGGRYQDIHSQVLQDCVNRVRLAFDRFIKGDCNGNRSGRPRFKNKSRYRSFTYTQMDNSDIQGNRINLSKIGWVRLILHRPLPDGFKVKTAIITKKADGWYATLSLENTRVPELTSDIQQGGSVQREVPFACCHGVCRGEASPRPTPWGDTPPGKLASPDIPPRDDNSIGIDLGLEKFLVDSEGNFESIPQHFREAEEKLAKLQQKASAHHKGSRARKLLYRKVAKLHQKIARQRRQFHFETAKKILNKADVVFVEDLSIKNMSRRAKSKQDETDNYLPNGQSQKVGLNKSIADAGWAGFIEILCFKAERAGCKVIKVNPKGTSQHCSNCLNKVPKQLSDRWHSCSCGLEIDRDTNSAILIKKLGLGVFLSIKRSTRKRREACAVT